MVPPRVRHIDDTPQRRLLALKRVDWNIDAVITRVGVGNICTQVCTLAFFLLEY
jgi:hypothetical protein